MPDTLTVAISLVRDRLDEAGTSSGQWTDSNLRRWLWEGMKDVSRRANCNRDTIDVTATASINEYVLSTGNQPSILRIYRCEWLPGGADTRRIPMTPSGYEAMDNIWWQQQDQAVGTPTFYTTWGRPPTLKLKIYPAPYQNSSFRLFVSRLPIPIDFTGATDNSTNIDLPEGWLECAYDYCEYMALRKDRDSRWQESLQAYEAKVDSMIRNVDNYMDSPEEVFFDSPTGPLPGWLTRFDW
jgi:hypothetical protein